MKGEKREGERECPEIMLRVTGSRDGTDILKCVSGEIDGVDVEIRSRKGPLSREKAVAAFREWLEFLAGGSRG